MRSVSLSSMVFIVKSIQTLEHIPFKIIQSNETHSPISLDVSRLSPPLVITLIYLRMNGLPGIYTQNQRSFDRNVSKIVLLKVEACCLKIETDASIILVQFEQDTEQAYAFLVVRC